MATKKSRSREGKTDSQNLLHHRMTKQEVREKTSREIARSHESFPPIFWEPLSNKDSRENNPTRPPPDKGLWMIRSLSTRAENTEKIRRDRQARSRMNGNKVLWQLRSLLQKCQTQTTKGEPSRMDRSPRYFPKRLRFWTTHLVKKSH